VGVTRHPGRPGPRGLLVVVACVAACAFLVPACGSSGGTDQQALEGSRAISFRTPDGVRLEGRLFGPAGATAGVVLALAHMLPADQSSFYDLAAHLGAQGYRVLTFDFRGYCPGGDAGCSEGDRDPAAAPIDLGAAVAELRSRGVGRVGLVGASMGGTAAIRVAASEGDAVETLVTLSAPQVIEGLSVGPAELQTVTAAKLFVAGNADGRAAADAEAFYLASLQPKRYEILTTDAHGTDLLTSGQGQRVIDLVDGWLAATLPVDPSSEPSPA
jgi:pimeloyl-ACP methyl ester carboxylesterase